MFFHFFLLVFRLLAPKQLVRLFLIICSILRCKLDPEKPTQRWNDASLERSMLNKLICASNRQQWVSMRWIRQTRVASSIAYHIIFVFTRRSSLTWNSFLLIKLSCDTPVFLREKACFPSIHLLAIRYIYNGESLEGFLSVVFCFLIETLQ